MRKQQRGPYRMIQWRKFKKDFKELEKNDLFWVAVQRNEMAEFFCAPDIDLDTQLFDFEWPTRDEFRFLLYPKSGEFYKFYISGGLFAPIRVKLGHKDSLKFQDFQVHFNIDDRTEFLAILHNLHKNVGNFNNLLTDILKIASIPQQSGSKTLDDISSHFKEWIKSETPPQARDIPNPLTIDDFVFSPDRIARYCLGCLPNQLDFLFTYRNSDIVCALKAGPKQLEEYLKTAPRIKCVSPWVQQALSLFFPTYLKSYYDYWNQLLLDYDDEFYSKRNLVWYPIDKDCKDRNRENLSCSFQCREDCNLEDVWNVLCILTNDIDAATESFRKEFFNREEYPPDQISQRVKNLLEILECENIPEDVTKSDEYVKYIKRYFSVNQTWMADELCQWINWLRIVVKSSSHCGIRSNDRYFLFPLFLTLIGDINEVSGVLIEYFDVIEHQNNVHAPIIIDRTKMPVDDQAKVYQAYLSVNEFCLFILSRISGLPTLYSRMEALTEVFRDIEFKYLKELFTDERFTDDERQVFVDSVIKRDSAIDVTYPFPFRRMPEYHRVVIESFERKIAEKKLAAAEAQRDVFMKVGHSIKNLVASIVSPLSLLKDELIGSQRIIVENALAGTKLIRNLAQSMHLSLRAGSWRKDIENPGQHPILLNSILFHAFHAALLNMFDGKYFHEFVKNYFKKDLQLFLEAKQQCQDAQTEKEFSECVNKYFFEFKCESKGNSAIPIGDAEGTATKLLILFQELFLNAIKYSSYIERKDRFVHILIDINADHWSFIVRNSAVQTDAVNSSGIGLSIIRNFANLFDADYSAELISAVYQSKLNFSLKEKTKNA